MSGYLDKAGLTTAWNSIKDYNKKFYLQKRQSYGAYVIQSYTTLNSDVKIVLGNYDYLGIAQDGVRSYFEASVYINVVVAEDEDGSTAEYNVEGILRSSGFSDSGKCLKISDLVISPSSGSGFTVEENKSTATRELALKFNTPTGSTGSYSIQVYMTVLHDTNFTVNPYIDSPYDTEGNIPITPYKEV